MKRSAIAGAESREGELLELTDGQIEDEQFKKWLTQAASVAGETKSEPGAHLEGEALASYKRGSEIYATICAVCHGPDGAGLDNLGPLLDGSDWVTGDEKRLVSILLHGLQGPIHINGERFEGAAVMPGLSFNPTITDEKLADVVNFIRNSWSNKAKPITADFAKEVRAATAERGGRPYTEGDFKK